jgi:hypothetical protein
MEEDKVYLALLPSVMIIILDNRRGETSILNNPVNKLIFFLSVNGGESLMIEAFSLLVTPSGTRH